MTPLSDALTAAQRRALAAVEKAYVAGHIEQEAAAEVLEGCGITDPVDRAFLFASLDVLREWGAPVPAENGSGPKVEPMSDKQRDFIQRLLEEKGIAPDDYPDSAGLTKAQAHEIIDSLQNGSYDPEKWRVPF